MWKKIQSKFVNQDGTINGKVLAGAISALILLGQQVALAGGYNVPNHLGDWVNVINTVLVVLTMLGVVSEPGKVAVPVESETETVSQQISQSASTSADQSVSQSVAVSSGQDKSQSVTTSKSQSVTK
jgi:uncharacterized membrane protein